MYIVDIQNKLRCYDFNLQHTCTDVNAQNIVFFGLVYIYMYTIILHIGYISIKYAYIKYF